MAENAEPKPRISLTKRAVDNLPTPEKGRDFYRDTVVSGLSIMVTHTGSKVWKVIKKLNGKKVFVTLGNYPLMTPEMARKAAQSALADLVQGANPNTKKKQDRAKGATLGQTARAYIASRTLKPASEKDIHRCISETFSDWEERPIALITREMVATRHRERAKISPARANNAMRWLRALWNYARSVHRDENDQPLLGENPVQVMKDRRLWSKVDRKQTLIAVHQLAPWWVATHDIGDATVIDFFVTLLYTGLRKSELQGLRWEDVDFDGATLTVRDTKNGRTHTLPMGHRLVSRLKPLKRKRGLVFDVPDHRYRGPQAEILERTGIKFTPHDLRRTFATIAEGLGASELTIKRLLNHVTNTEVTGGYIVFTPERLRPVMQQVEDFIAEKVEA